MRVWIHRGSGLHPDTWGGCGRVLRIGCNGPTSEVKEPEMSAQKRPKMSAQQPLVQSHWKLFLGTEI